MSTSLAKQLKKLSLPGQSVFQVAGATRKPSFLFEAKEAAEIDTDTIYALGFNGLEELISLEPAFTEFTSSLFSESCKLFERSVETREVVKQVDAAITKFLHLLSSYFLLRPAHKCLEWLIRTFQIHHYNTNSLMECVLPFYETNLFARVVQLIPVKDPNSFWHWLSPIQKSGTPLSRLTLTQHCISDPSFLSFVCEMVPKSLKTHRQSKTLSGTSCRVLISFYCSTVVHILERDVIAESLVTTLLPYLIKGMKSSYYDYKAASLMIISLLGSKVVLDVKLTLSLLDSITKYFRTSLTEEAVSCMIVLCTNSENIETLSKTTVKHVLSCSSTILQALECVCTQCDSSSFINPLLKSMLEKMFDSNSNISEEEEEHEQEDDETGKIILHLLDKIPLVHSTALQVVRSLLKHYITTYQCTTIKCLRMVYLITQSLDVKYPTVFDKVIQEYLGGRKGERKKEVGVLQKFITMALPGSRHEFTPGTNSSLVLTIHHPDSNVRLDAVKHLIKLLHGTEAMDKECGDSTHIINDKEFVSSALLARLTDDSPKVVMATLEAGPEILLSSSDDKDYLFKCLMRLISRKKLIHGSEEWQSCVSEAVTILSSRFFIDNFPDKLNTIVLALLPLVFVGYHGNKQCRHILHVIAGSPLSQVHQILKEIENVCKCEVWSDSSHLVVKDPEVLGKMNTILINNLAEGFVNLETGRVSELIKEMMNSVDSVPSDIHDHMTRIMFIALLGIAIATFGNSYQLNLTSYLENQSHLIRVSSPVLMSLPTLQSVFQQLMQKRPKNIIDSCYVQILLWTVDKLIENTSPPNDLKSSLWLSLPSLNITESVSDVNPESNYYMTLVTIFKLLTQWINDFSHMTEVTKCLLQKLIKLHFSGRGSLLRFLAMIWNSPISPNQTDSQTNSSGMITDLVRVRALRIAAAYIKSMDNSALLALSGNCCPVISSLLICLSNPQKSVRQNALSCLLLLNDAATSSDPKTLSDIYLSSPLLHLLDAIATSKLELIADQMGIQLLLERLFLSKEDRDGVFQFKKDFSSETLGSSSRRKSRRKAESRARSAILESILDSLMSVTVSIETPPSYIICQLLSVLSGVDHEKKLTALMSVLRRSLQQLKQDDDQMKSEDEDSISQHLLELIISCYTPQVSQWLPQQPEVFQMFLNLLTFSSLGTLSASPSVLALKQISPEFFISLKSSELQQILLQSLIDMLVASRRSKVTSLIKNCLQQLPLTGEMMITELIRHQKNIKGEEPIEATPSKKRSRKSKVQKSPTEINLEGDVLLSWIRIMAILEIMQNKCSDITECHMIVPHLFTIFSCCLETKDGGDSEVLNNMEYIQQLILSVLLEICKIISEEGVNHAQEMLPETSFNVEQVVQCLRLTSNPHTHHTALLLLATSVSIYPTRIIHNIMPIFTFMGHNLTRQDDEYTFEIIKKTLDTIIPALIKHNSNIKPVSRHQSYKTTHPSLDPSLGSVTDILRVFVDAVPHIPHHRRLPLLSHLLSTVGSMEYLYVVLGLLAEKCVLQSGEKQTPKDTILDSRFLVSLARSFSDTERLHAVLKLIQYMCNLPEDRPERTREVREISQTVTYLFNIPLHSFKQLRQFKFAVLSLLIAIIGKLRLDKGEEREEVIKSIGQEEEEEEMVDMEQLIRSVLQETLEYVGLVHKSRGSASDSTSVKYWEAMLSKTYDVIDKVVSLISLDSFLNILHGLLSSCDENTKRKAMNILNRKLEDSTSKFTEQQEVLLMEFMSLLGGVASDQNVSTVTRQTALYGLKLIAKRVEKPSEQFTKVAEELINMFEVESLDPLLYSNVLLCLAEICHALPGHMIRFLPVLMPHVLSHVGHVQEGHEFLHLSTLISLKIIIENISTVNVFIYDIILKICHPDLVIEGRKETLDIVQEATKLREVVCNIVSPRVIFPVIKKVYSEIRKHDKASVLVLLDMLNASINNISREDVKSNIPILIDIFITLFDYRIDDNQVLEVDIFEVEEKINYGFTELAVKLSEISFRPIFLKLLDWASSSGAPQDRMITFFHLTKSIALKFKSLFLLFAGHLVGAFAKMLDWCNTYKKQTGQPPFVDSSYSTCEEKTCLVLKLILDTMYTCFLHDKHSFVTKETFNILLQPLVDQVCNTIGGTTVYQERIQGHLVPCISQFAAAAGKDSLLKPLNYQLLLKTRESNTQVRFAALMIAQDMYRKLGEEFTVLLPETIPFLAELMEDESVEVEQQTQVTIATIEEITGESIQQYF